MLAWTPDTKTGTATIEVDFHYYTSLRTKKYYQHHNGAEEAKKAAERFVVKCHPDALCSTIEHQIKKQCFYVTIVEKLQHSNAEID